MAACCLQLKLRSYRTSSKINIYSLQSVDCHQRTKLFVICLKLFQLLKNFISPIRSILLSHCADHTEFIFSGHLLSSFFSFQSVSCSTSAAQGLDLLCSPRSQQ